MAHARQQIREAVANLVTGLASTGTNVFQNRVYPLEETNLPCILIGSSEEVVTEHYDATYQLRELTVTVTGVVKAGADVDDALDDISEQVEIALYGDRQLSGLAKFGGLQESIIEIMGDAELPTGQVEMSFMYLYNTDGQAPGVLL